MTRLYHYSVNQKRINILELIDLVIFPQRTPGKTKANKLLALTVFFVVFQKKISIRFLNCQSHINILIIYDFLICTLLGA